VFWNSPRRLGWGRHAVATKIAHFFGWEVEETSARLMMEFPWSFPKKRLHSMITLMLSI
jgi:hypothetical protein